MKSNVATVTTTKRRNTVISNAVVVPPKWAHVATTTTTTSATGSSDVYDDSKYDKSYQKRKSLRLYQNNPYDIEGDAVHEEEEQEVEVEEEEYDVQQQQQLLDVWTCAYQTITVQYLHNTLLCNALQQTFVHNGAVVAQRGDTTQTTTTTTTTTIMNEICQFLSSTSTTLDAKTTITTATTTTTTANATSAIHPTTTATTDIAATAAAAAAAASLDDIATAATKKTFDASTTTRTTSKNRNDNKNQMNHEDSDDNDGVEKENDPGGTFVEGNSNVEEEPIIINETLSQCDDEGVDHDIYNKYMIPSANDNSCNAINASDKNSNSNNNSSTYYTYDPLLLPIVMIENGPFAHHDRQFVLSYIMQTMQQPPPSQPSISNTKKLSSSSSSSSSSLSSNCCCVWLTLPSSNIYKMTNRTLYQEIVYQCWKQEIQMKIKMQQQQHKQNSNSSTRSIDQLVQQQLKQISSLSLTEQLLLFASQTQYFQNIIIFWFIEHGNILYNHHHSNNNESISFEIFVKWCNERRSYYGIPISIIMYNPAATTNHYRRSIPYYSTNIQSSIAGLRVRSINSLPTNSILLQTILQNLYHDAISDTNISISPTTITTKSTTEPYLSCFALFIIQLCYSHQPKTMANIWYIYQYTDHSIVRLLHSIEEIICHYCSSAMSSSTTKLTLFINAVTIILASLSNIPTNAHTSGLSRHITSLFYDHSFRRMISSEQHNNNNDDDDDNHNIGETIFSSNKLFQYLETYEVNRYMSSLAIQLYSMIWDNFLVQVVHSMIPTITFPIWLLFGHTAVVHESSQNTRLWYDTLHTLLNDNDRRSMIEMVGKFRTECNVASTTVFNKLDLFPEEQIYHQNNIRIGVLSSCNEFIVLLDHCKTIYDVQRCLRSLILMNTGMDIVDSVIHETAYSDDNNNDSCCRIPLPRRDHVDALMKTINTSSTDENGKSSVSLVDVPGRMYQMIQDRVQISEMDWYGLFLNQYSKDEIKSIERHHNVYHVFGYGTYHLQLSGLVRRIEGKNGSIQYERTALVWCGGE